MPTTRLDRARAVADSVLYEGYLLYPYRASQSMNQTRGQFGVLGPVGAEHAGVGESSTMSMQCLLTSSSSLVVHLRFLQLQHRSVHDSDEPVAGISDANGTSWMAWDEAVEHELTFELSPFDLEAGGTILPVAVEGQSDVEQLGQEGRAVRCRWPLTAEMRMATAPSDGCLRLDVEVLNLHDDPGDAVEATRYSLIGTHVIIEALHAEFVSLLDPPDELAEPAVACIQHRCWPVLGGERGDTDLILALPILLYDHPEIASASPGDMYDATEIVEPPVPESVEPAWPGLSDIRDVDPPTSGADADSRR